MCLVQQDVLAYFWPSLMHATPLHSEQKPCGGRSLQGRALSEHMFLLNYIILGRWTVVAIFMGDWHHVPSNTRKRQKCVSVKLINSIVEGVVSWHWWTLWFLVISWAFHFFLQLLTSSPGWQFLKLQLPVPAAASVWPRHRNDRY